VKKFVAVFVAVVMLVAFTVNDVQASGVKKLLNISDEIRKESILLDKQNVDLRDFDFFVKIMFVYLKAWNDQIRDERSQEAKVRISKSYVAILSAQYVSMRQYVKEYVIKKSPQKAQTERKCARLVQLLNEGINTLR